MLFRVLYFFFFNLPQWNVLISNAVRARFEGVHAFFSNLHFLIWVIEEIPTRLLLKGPQTTGKIPEGGGGGIPLYKPYRYVPPHLVGFLRRFGLKPVYTSPILVWSRVWFSRELRNVWKYLSFQFQISKKKREICELEMDLNNFFLRSNG